MIDLHCHLDLYPNALELLKLVEERNRFTLVVTTSPRGWQATSRVFRTAKNIECAVGMHPEIVSDKYAEKHLLIKSLRNCRFIGEVGIDGSTRYRGSIEKQIEIFTEVVQESEILGGRILSIHSRSAASKVLDIIEDKGIMSTFILHWFSGSLSQLKRAVDLGCLFSVGPAMTNSSNGRQLLSHMPLTRVLPESDGPFATRGCSPIMPWEAISIAKFLADSKEISHQEAKDTLLENFENVMEIAETTEFRPINDQ